MRSREVCASQAPDQCAFGIGEVEMLESAIGDCGHGGRHAGNATSLVSGVEVNVVGENGESGFWDGSVADHTAV